MEAAARDNAPAGAKRDSPKRGSGQRGPRGSHQTGEAERDQAPVQPESDGAASGIGPDVMQAASQAVQRAGRALRDMVPAADLDARDTDYIRETLPGLWMLASLYFRADVRGLHHVPEEGPVLLVGNHSGGMMAPDLFVFVLAFCTYFGVERRFYQLAHNGVVAGPAGGMVRKYGAVAADPRNAELALKSGAAVLVYPGGDYEVFRPTWESGKVDFGGRHGFIRLALEMGVPIQPVVSIGSQETALFLTRGRRLAKLARLDKLMRLKTAPFLFGLPFGFMPAVFGHIPLPSKITIQVMRPIDLRERYGEDPDVDAIYDDVLGQMQDVLDSLADQRQLPVIG
ncbi:MAG TPA: lysophospholipid acyltransferase family protein [Solirubrobacteraceae bacterium]|jgi:1-acyl-sn-glycerol-3-phosphate acyltransferase|nr:lysophospholipid acyltransferase family protein [Solirubrobacteraceae bacterium]